MPSSNNRINFQVGYNVDQASVSAVKKSLQQIGKIKPTNFTGTKKELDQIKLTANKVEQALEKAFNINLNSLNVSAFKQELQSAGLSVDMIYQQFSKAGVQGQNAFRNMASSVLTTNLQLKQTKSLITSMGQTMANTVKWGIASSIMNSFSNSVRQAFQYTKSLDSALTDIRIVTGDSVEQMREFAKEANSAAQGLGRSTMDYTKAALTFYQQGLSDEEVRTRTQTVLKAQNITGAGQEMADYLTAVWNGYKVANEEAELYVDKLAAVADSSASNMSQLAVAMSKVAATANALGVPVDSLNAQIATITATTRQAPETVGNALKTIYARINDIKTGADDAQVSLGNYSGTMAKLGFNVLDANGNLKDTGVTLEQIGQKWATLSREQQIYLARTMAGQRQYNNLIALFDNWGKYTDLVNVSMESQGTTMEKNSRYMDSLEAKLEQLGAASQRVKDALINEEDLKGLTSLGTNITNLFGSFVQSIGGGKNALLALGGIITSVFSGTIAKELTSAINHFQIVKNNISQINTEIQTTKELGLSQAYSSGIIKDMVDSKKQIQQYYSTMSTEEIKAYNSIVNRIGAQRNSLDILNQQIREIKHFEQSVQSAGQKINNDLNTQLDLAVEETQKLDNQLKNLTVGDLKNNNTFTNLINQVQQLEDVVGKDAVPAFKAFDNVLKDISTTISSNGTVSTNQLASLKRAAEEALSQTNNMLGKDLDQVSAKANQAEQSVKKLNAERERMVASARNGALGQNLTSYVSSLVQILNIYNNISRISSIWENNSLSHGEKLRQTLTNVGFSLMMAISAYKQITSAMGIQNLLADKRFLKQHAITLQKQAQAAAQIRAGAYEALRNRKSYKYGISSYSKSFKRFQVGRIFNAVKNGSWNSKLNKFYDGAGRFSYCCRTCCYSNWCNLI